MNLLRVLKRASFCVGCGWTSVPRAWPHMRTDAINFVTIASATRLPEQREIVHMIQMLRKEACVGQTEDLAHVVSVVWLSFCLTRASAEADDLAKVLEQLFISQGDRARSQDVPALEAALAHVWHQDG